MESFGISLSLLGVTIALVSISVALDRVVNVIKNLPKNDIFS